MKNELVYYDVYPRIVPLNRETVVHIRPLSRHVRFDDNKTYYIHVIPTDERARSLRTGLSDPGSQAPGRLA